MALLEVEDLHRVYSMGDIDVPVLRGVSFTIERGERVALMGASGSGKSTLMNLLGCLDRATSGRYRLAGEEVTELSSDQRARLRNRKIGFVFQSFHLLPRTTALEQTLMPLAYADDGTSPSAAEPRARELLERVGLGARLDHTPNQLSGGQQQRVAIARALIRRPPLLLADEPTGNLDSRTSLEILEMFRELNEREGVTIVLVTHDPEVAARAQRTIHLRDGRIVDAAAALATVRAGA
jgi:ABC-type lipoprotein export system ATPase subunit